MSGANQACYKYHLGVAESSEGDEQAAHCAHALGLADADGNAPCTDPEPASFCERYATACGEWPVEDTTCADWWAAAAPGEEGAMSGASQACYDYHLGVAEGLEGDEQAAHCAHALGLEDAEDLHPLRLYFCVPRLGRGPM